MELWTQRDFDSMAQHFSETHFFKSILRTRITGVEQIDFDRVVRITCQRKTELGQQKEYDLIFELTGRNTNLIIVNREDKRILECLRKVDPSRSRYRQIAPGLKYILPPPPRKKNPLETSAAEFEKSLSLKAHREISTFLLDSFSGMDRLLAQKIKSDSSVSIDKEVSQLTEGERENLSRSFQNTFQKIKESKLSPHIILDQQGDITISWNLYIPCILFSLLSQTLNFISLMASPPLPSRYR